MHHSHAYVLVALHFICLCAHLSYGAKCKALVSVSGFADANGFSEVVRGKFVMGGTGTAVVPFASVLQMNYTAGYETQSL